MKGQPVLIMEYIAGPSMQNIVVQKQEEHVTGRRLKLIRDMAEALEVCPLAWNLSTVTSAHETSSALPGSTGVKLIDFGLTVPATPHLSWFLGTGQGLRSICLRRSFGRRSTDQAGRHISPSALLATA